MNTHTDTGAVLNISMNAISIPSFMMIHQAIVCSRENVHLFIVISMRLERRLSSYNFPFWRVKLLVKELSHSELYQTERERHYTRACICYTVESMQE